MTLNIDDLQTVIDSNVNLIDNNQKFNTGIQLKQSCYTVLFDNNYKPTIYQQVVQKTDLISCKRKDKSNKMIWSQNEDEKLQFLVLQNKQLTWNDIAVELKESFPLSNTRTPMMCRQRWVRVINPNLVKGKWGKQEDYLLLKALKLTKFAKWQQISQQVPGRTDVQVRYRTIQNSDWFVQRGAPQKYLDYKMKNVVSQNIQ
ncbi:Myb-like_DNA-binding domain-containing protein [Hexamita inflata]|uniref:Myb-like DNA-binding domain-containing protein n=1 Tax=Hexamita inflata TaxID=28002 RepID=A0AA86R9W9_9EUKA|nr:Myb-like DNA-binding domain-containing protein [Hexamita inflata]